MWSVCRINSVKLACPNLSRQGFGTFRPCLMEKRAKRGVLTKVDVPLFGHTYLFVSIPEGAHWPAISNTYGVNKLMTRRKDADEYQSPVDVTKFVEQLKQCSSYYEGTDKWHLAVGTKVTVLSGPFKNHTAEVFSEMNGSDRVNLLLFLLGRENVVVVHRMDVAPAQD